MPGSSEVRATTVEGFRRNRLGGLRTTHYRRFSLQPRTGAGCPVRGPRASWGREFSVHQGWLVSVTRPTLTCSGCRRCVNPVHRPAIKPGQAGQTADCGPRMAMLAFIRQVVPFTTFGTAKQRSVDHRRPMEWNHSVMVRWSAWPFLPDERRPAKTVAGSDRIPAVWARCLGRGWVVGGDGQLVCGLRVLRLRRFPTPDGCRRTDKSVR